MKQTIEEMQDSEELCKYCIKTDYGERKAMHTPNGYYTCEGSYCEEAYDAYLEEEED
jgi:hypothetical protein